MAGISYTELRDDSFRKLRRKLLRERGSEFQLEFLKAAQKNLDFLGFIMDNVKIARGSESIILCPNPLTENEFKNPPTDTEQDLYNAWSNITPRIACRTTFWAYVTLDHIESDRIQASYLTADSKPTTNGANDIKILLQKQGKERKKLVDENVRRALRRFGGLQEARGSRSVYVDCPFARAWWRERLVRQVSNADPVLEHKVRDVLRWRNSYWEKLVMLVVSRNSILGSRRIQNSFILSLAELFAGESSTPLKKEAGIRFACQAIGSIQASRELSILDDDELREITDNVVKTIHYNPNFNRE